MDEPTIQFDELYDEYADAIFRHLSYRLGSRERALDLTQEVFAGLWRQLQAGKRLDNARAYLYRSAHNAFVNEIGRTKKELSLERLAETGFDPEDGAASPEAAAEQRELIEKLAQVQEPYRSALVLRYVDGFRIKEIAELLREQENTISVRVRRGTELLKQIYGTV